MDDCIIWVNADISSYIKVEMLNYAYPEEVHKIQKKFVDKGYTVNEVEQTKDGRMVYTFLKQIGEREYEVCKREDLEPCKEK